MSIATSFSLSIFIFHNQHSDCRTDRRHHLHWARGRTQSWLWDLKQGKLLCLFLLFPCMLQVTELNVNASLPIKEVAVKTKTNIFHNQSSSAPHALSQTISRIPPHAGRRSARRRPHLLTDHLYKCSPCAGWWLILCRTCQFCPLKRERLPVSKQCATDELWCKTDQLEYNVQ